MFLIILNFWLIVIFFVPIHFSQLKTIEALLWIEIETRRRCKKINRYISKFLPTGILAGILGLLIYQAQRKYQSIFLLKNYFALQRK